MVVNVEGGFMTDEEKQLYVDYLARKFPGRKFDEITLKIDGKYIDISYVLKDYPPFERIRRITGYLVGDMTRWNNGKRAEEADRVKHGVEDHD